MNQLVNQLGYQDSPVKPMVVEGPEGMVLGAIGEVQDHAAAGDYLEKLHAERTGRPRQRLQVADRPAASSTGNRNRSRNRRSSRSGNDDGHSIDNGNGNGGGNGGGNALAQIAKRGFGGRSGDNSNGGGRGGVVFGAVYEYRDAVGVPKLVSSTEQVPEAQFVADTQAVDAHGSGAAVRKLMTTGSPSVVWAGCGRAPIGREEMEGIRSAIVEERSRRMHIAKLRSEKPYSRHGYGTITDEDGFTVPPRRPQGFLTQPTSTQPHATGSSRRTPQLPSPFSRDGRRAGAAPPPSASSGAALPKTARRTALEAGRRRQEQRQARHSRRSQTRGDSRR